MKRVASESADGRKITLEPYRTTGCRKGYGMNESEDCARGKKQYDHYPQLSGFSIGMAHEYGPV